MADPVLSSFGASSAVPTARYGPGHPYPPV